MYRKGVVEVSEWALRKHWISAGRDLSWDLSTDVPSAIAVEEGISRHTCNWRCFQGTMSGLGYLQSFSFLPPQNNEPHAFMSIFIVCLLCYVM